MDKVATICPRRHNDTNTFFFKVDPAWGEGEQFRVKVSAVDDASVYGFSPAFFSIQPSRAEERKRADRAARLERQRKERVRQQEGLEYVSSDEEDVAGIYKVVPTAIGSRLVAPKPRRGVESQFTAKKEEAHRFIVKADDYSNYVGDRNRRGRAHGHGCVRVYVVASAVFCPCLCLCWRMVTW